MADSTPILKLLTTRTSLRTRSVKLWLMTAPLERRSCVMMPSTVNEAEVSENDTGLADVSRFEGRVGSLEYLIARLKSDGICTTDVPPGGGAAICHAMVERVGL